ncbi:MAG: glycoside hydrolase family 97 protein [Culturomica sp.]|jgi:hypothetical protein|nr:glycoside hydrolase family 97 protein [Culturomica sp.]
MRYIKYLIVVCLLCASCAEVRTQEEIVSPNGRLSVKYTVENRLPAFEIYANQPDGKKKVSDLSSIGILTKEGLNGDLVLESVSKPKEIETAYTMLTGKRKECRNKATETTYSFKDKTGKRLNLDLRVYDDGIAFRYELPAGGMITDELTTYQVSDSATRWLQKYAPLSYEDFYNCIEPDQVQANRKKIGYPALFKTTDDVYMLLTESGIRREHCASLLSNEENASLFKVKLGQDSLAVDAGWASPWRTAIIGSLADVVESTLVTDLSEPCALEDVSWIKPGVASWIYWAYNHGSKDFQLIKQYVDMAKELHLPYVLIDWEWESMGNGGNIDDAVKYALSQGVKPLLWYNSFTAWIGESAPGTPYLLNNADTRRKEFAKLESMGVAGVKIDFFSGDSQATIDYYLDLLEDAAKYHLLVNFHGATVPRGWQRTYPNMVSVEGVYGAEWYNNAPILTNKAAAHNATLPFTRNVIGPMDYTPTTFTDSQHKHITTHAHELALTVVFESAVQHLADRPSSYLSQSKEVKDFLQHLPTVWDNTKLLSGYPGESVVIARQKDGKWYVGGLNGTNESLTLPLSMEFLGKGDYQVTLFKDGKEAHSFDIEKETYRGENLEIPCLPRGGFVAIITKK